MDHLSQRNFNPHDDTETRLEDNWKVVGNRTLAKQCRDTSELEEDVKLPLDPSVVCGRSPKELAVPTEPTPRERELRNLDHILRRPWCTLCVRAKGRISHLKKKNASQVRGPQ